MGRMIKSFSVKMMGWSELPRSVQHDKVVFSKDDGLELPRSVQHDKVVFSKDDGL